MAKLSLMRIGIVATLLIALPLTHCLTDDLPPGVSNSQDPADVSLTPEVSLTRIRLPHGFRATLFAGEPDIRRPLGFDLDDRGRLWVIENYSHPIWKEGPGQDRIVILEDTDHDGQFDKRIVFWDKGRYLSGIAYGHGGVWIGNAPELAFIPDRNRDDVPDSEPIVKLDGFQVTKNNMLNNFHWGPDGWLYGAVGVSDQALVGPPGAPNNRRTRITRGIWRYHPSRGEFEEIASGMVNPWGADFNEYGDLITSNTVIAHLWHIVPGMHAQRRGSEAGYPFAYQRIQTIADHLHWGGGKWQDSRQTNERHSVAGGGHAHCGGMIYLGDNWPAEYLGTFFTGNLHGNRINNDALTRRGSTYVATHRPDFLHADDDWFRSLTQRYGPDGGVFISDWHDLGECHDSDGSHRSSGRIYKVVHGSPEHFRVDLQSRSDAELIDLHTHANEWFVRHARRILQERKRAPAIHGLLKQRFRDAGTTTLRLRYLWTLYVTEGLTDPDLLALLADQDEYVRRWAVTLLVDPSRPINWSSPWTAANSNPPGEGVVVALRRLASDSSPLVRLAIACSLQRLPLEQRWQIAAQLTDNATDEFDAYLPLLIWYGVEPLVSADTTRALQLAAQSQLSTVSRLIARRAADISPASFEDVLDHVAATRQTQPRKAMLSGLLASIEQQRYASPKNWARVKRILAAASDDELEALTARIAIALGDPQATQQLKIQVSDVSIDTTTRRSALLSLSRIEGGITLAELHDLIRCDDPLRGAAIPLLKPIATEATGRILLTTFHTLTDHEQADAVAVLVGQAKTARQMLDAIANKALSPDVVSAYALHTLRSLPDKSLREIVSRLFANADSTSKAEQIAKYKQLLSADFLATAELPQGRKMFDATCAKCHQLFGEGNNFAPDLTGSGRMNLDYLLSNLIDPSSLIDPAYRVTNVVTEDGRLFSGFLVTHSERVITLMTPDGEVAIPHGEVELLETSSTSMMPEGLLQSYTDHQVRDLIGYLMSRRQVE